MLFRSLRHAGPDASIGLRERRASRPNLPLQERLRIDRPFHKKMARAIGLSLHRQRERDLFGEHEGRVKPVEAQRPGFESKDRRRREGSHPGHREGLGTCAHDAIVADVPEARKELKLAPLSGDAL